MIHTIDTLQRPTLPPTMMNTLQRPTLSLTMTNIPTLVKHVLDAGYLSVAAENKLRSMLREKCEVKDLEALTRLQQAVIDGQVKQESREALYAEIRRHRSVDSCGNWSGNPPEGNYHSSSRTGLVR